MKSCPRCGTCDEDSARTCHRDETPLVPSIPGPCTIAERYFALQRLGAGGSGTVLRATHLGTGRPVALKVLATHLADRPEWRERFRREAAAIGRLRHPNIVDVVDFGMVDSPRGTIAYLAMEYLSGAPLTRWLEAGPLAPARAAGWLLEAAAAVDYAHRAGVLHRDLKPDNIWIEELPGGSQRVKVLDFGLAKTVGPAPEPEAPGNLPPVVDAVSIADEMVEVVERDERAGAGRPPTLSFEIDLEADDDVSAASRRTTLALPSRSPADGGELAADRPHHGPVPPAGDGRNLTELGTVMGTPAYMSPEQATGLGATRASDVYALGVIAFEMVTGDVPFHGTTAELLRHHRDDPAPDPGTLARGLPRSMRRAVLSALAKSPEARPRTALELARSFAGSLSIDRLAGRAIVLYLSLVVLWVLSRAMLSPWIAEAGPDRAAALRALAAANLVYFLAASLALLLVEARREPNPVRLWPLCVLAFPLVPVWLVLVARARQRDDSP